MVVGVISPSLLGTGCRCGRDGTRPPPDAVPVAKYPMTIMRNPSSATWTCQPLTHKATAGLTIHARDLREV
ncbi:hypothetical protein Ate02nite_08720 [Paractinoplanes tereljensis]|uniref:Uncharacterized protein n=1 Tax=Paractinoplanes tereljensis TaxID=571912 RepID=A0A919TRJ2_9ACTN|nr:hypothetical protein Ate02nite_08720 [Actinoplanes tereljensis]